MYNEKQFDFKVICKSFFLKFSLVVLFSTALANPSNDEANEVHAPEVNNPKFQSSQSVKLGTTV